MSIRLDRISHRMLLMQYLFVIETINRKPKPFKVDVTPRSNAVLQVVQQSAEETCTDIPDVDNIEMTD